jgi:autotransporter-associated beta strand protein
VEKFMKNKSSDSLIRSMASRIQTARQPATLIGGLPLFPIPRNSASNPMTTNLHSKFQFQSRRQGRFLHVFTETILALLFFAPATFAAIRYLDLNDIDPGFGTAGSPDITTTTTWTLDPTGVAAPATFPAGDFMTIGNVASDFNGSVISINMNLANNLTANPGGLNIISTNVTITLAGTANCRYNQTFSWTVAAGSTLIITDTGNNNGWNFNSRICTFAGGGTIDFRSAFCANGNALNTMNMPGGTLKLEQTTTSNFGAAAAGAFTLTAGTLQFVSPESLTRAFAGWANANTFSITGGTIDNLSGAPGAIYVGTSGKYSFDGNVTFTGSSSLSLSNAAVTLTGTRQVMVSANTLGIGGVISGAGFGLTKLGNGTLLLSGANTYSGNTTIISAGTLALANAGSISSSPLVVSNATFDISGLTAATTLPSLSVSNSTLVVAELSPATNILATTLNVGGTTNIINITTLPLVTGYPTTFRIIKATAVNGTLNFGLGPLPASTPAFQGFLTNNAANGSVDFVLTNGPAPVRTLTWSGMNGGSPDGTWDVGGTPTWLNASSAPTTYNQNDLVTFNDTATGQNSVNLTTTLTPSSLTVSNNTRLYTLGGGGKISGNVGLNKQGSGTLILDETGGNDFSGAVTISGGTLQVGNNDGAGNLPLTGSVADNSALLFKRNDFVTVANIISGSGTVSQTGSGTLALIGGNTFTGAVSVLQGTLQAGNNSALGTTNGGTTVASGATLEIIANAINLGQEPITISGTGVGGAGALVNNSGSATFVGPNAARVTLAGDATVGGSGRFDLRSANTADPTLASLSTGGLPRKLTKVGTAAFGLIGITVDPQLGDIEVQQGIFSLEAAVTGTGNVLSNLTVLPGGTLQMFAVTNQVNKVITLGGDGSVNSVSVTSGAGNTIIGPMNITNDCIFNVNNNTVALNLNNVITGPGKITKVGAGLLTFSGSSPAYRGGLQVNVGNVIISGTLSNSLGVTVGAGKFTLNGTLLGTGGLTNAAGTIVAGSGTNLGPTDISGDLNPGDTNAVGTFTVSNLVLESGAAMNFDLGSTNTPGGGVNDLIIVNGDLTVNGNLITINPLGLLRKGSGNPYRLFTYTGNLIRNADLFVTGPNNYNFTVDISTPGQVNIIVSGGPPIWNGGSATTSNWSDPGNWNGVTINNGDSLFFNGPSRLSNVNDAVPDTTYTDLNFVAGASAFVLNGNPITLAGTVINNSANPQTVKLGLDFSGNHTLNGGTGGLIIGGGVTNTANLSTLTLAGNGTLTNLLGSTDVNTMTNIISVASNANWTLVNNPSSAPLTLPLQFDIVAGTFSFGSAVSAPTLTSTTVNGAPQDHRVGNTVGIATFNMLGGTLTTSARLNTGTAANATGIVNQVSGTFTIGNQFQGANGAATAASVVNVSGGTMNIGTVAAPTAQFYVASRGPGVLTVSGSGVLNCGTLDVSRAINPNIPGTVNLNGGIISATRVGTATANSVAGNTGNTATFNFNGGTLKASASSATFFQGNTGTPVVPITTIVKSGGAIIDTDTNVISILEPLQHDSSLGSTPDGGLTKRGIGTLTLTATNTYSGITLVNGGTLLVNGSLATSAVTVATNATLGGNGTINSNVAVNPGGTISPGTSIGVLTVTNNVNLQGRTFMEISKTSNTNDRLRSILGSITYGGTLTVTNLAGTLQGGESYRLFEATNYPGSFTAFELPPLAPGMSWNTSALASSGTISVNGALAPLSITGVAQFGTNIVFSGSGGTANGQYIVLASTNVTLPRSNWTRLLTNQFDGSGNFSVTNTVDPNIPNRFYLLQLP